MAPLKFADFTKLANDLLTNDFNFDRKFKAKSKTANGIEITTEGAMKSVGNAVSGKLTAKIPLGHGITLNKLGVGHNGRFFVDATYADAIEGLTLTTLVEDGAKIPPIGEIGVDYKVGMFNLNLKVDAVNGPTLKDAVSFQYEKFTCGAEIKVNTGLDNKAPASLADYNVAVAYADSDVSVCAITKAKCKEFQVAVHQNVSKDVQLAAVFDQGKTSALAFGGMFKLDSSTSIQGKVSSTGIVTVNAHQTVSPSLKLIATGEVDATNLSADSHKFGLQFLLS